MKVGIATFPRARNYGTALQALALQEVLKRYGAQVCFADHVCAEIRRAESVFDVKRVGEWRYTVAHLLNLPTAVVRAKRFANFAKTHMQFGTENPGAYDVMVAGSDQVWNDTITGGDPYYYLDFEDASVKKAAYAASFGVTRLPQARKAFIRNCLSDIPLLSVREMQAAHLVEEICGVQPSVMPDPTLLLTADSWKSFATVPRTKPYIFVYAVYHSDSIWAFAKRLSEKTGLPIKTVAYSTLHRRCKDCVYTAGPAEWLGYMMNAAYVVTNSFHGVAFSLNFEKPFFYELPPQKYGVGSRLAHITTQFGVQARTTDITDIDAALPVENIRAVLEQERRKADAFIARIINA